MMKDNANVPAFSSLPALLRKGFELTTSAWWILLIPVAVDCFLWLGTQLRINKVWDILMEANQSDLIASSFFNSTLLVDITESISKINLTTSIIIPVLGLPSLMAATSISETPIATQALEITSISELYGKMGLYMLIGLLLASVFHSLIAAVVLREKTGEAIDLGRVLSQKALRFFSLGVLFFFVFIVFIFAITLLLLMVVAIYPPAASILIFVLMLMAMWLVIYLWYSMFEVTLYGTPVLKAMLKSVRFMRRQLPVAMPILLTFLIATSILKSLWQALYTPSWLSLANIFGYAFITTALYITIYLFYYERTQVVAEVSAEAATPQ